MSAIKPQTIASELGEKIIAYDPDEAGSELELFRIKRGISDLKKVKAEEAYILEGFYYTYCEPSKAFALKSVEKGLKLNSFNPDQLSNAGNIYAAWGKFDRSFELYIQAFINSHSLETLYKLVRQAFVSANLEEANSKIEHILKNFNEKSLEDYSYIYGLYKKTDKDDLKFFKGKISEVLDSFGQSIEAAGIVNVDSENVLINIHVDSKNIDEVFDMNSMLEDLVIDSLEKSPSDLTVVYSFTVNSNYKGC